jgi:putative ABC transport system permease protein
MIQNYFKFILRGIINQKLYSLIKIIGFALGIAACFLIALWIADELGYDKNYPDGDRIYRVIGVYSYGGDISKFTSFPAPFARVLKDEFPEVEQAGRLNRTEFFGAGSNEVRYIENRQNNHEEGFAFADQELLDILQIPMVYGDPLHALDEPGTIVISKRKAQEFFPGENPVGKTLIINDDPAKQYKIGGVMNDPPVNSHFQSDFLMSLKNGLYPGEQSNWRSSSYDIYIKVKAGTDISQLESKFSVITTKYLIPSQREDGYVDAEELSELLSYELQPVSDIHLKSAEIQDGLKYGDIRFVWLFGIIAGFILIIACINFINLSTARFAGKAKTVGFLKAFGADRSNLVCQFLTESSFFSFLSFILGMIITVEILPYFNLLSGKSLTIPWSAWWWLLPLIFLISVIIGLLTGLYPSLYISSFKPANVIKENLTLGSIKSRMRNSLVIFQFTVSIVLIACTLIIYRQFEYTIKKDVGFDKDRVLLLYGTNTLGKKIITFKNELLKLPAVKSVSMSYYLPIEGTKRDGNALWKEGMRTVEKPVYGQFWRVDHDYIRTMGMKIAEGRDFSIDMPTDSSAAIVNQALVKQLELTDPVGKKISNQWETFEIIGVVKDFNYESIRNYIGGVCLTLGKSTDMASVKIGTGDISGTVHSITEVWNNFSPNQPVRYSFLAENFKTMYSDVQKMGLVFSTFAIFAIIIACLGLFALSSYIIERRTKEIGIRKVHGAKVFEAIFLLNASFIKWVIIASVIAIPVAYYSMHRWLDNFAYKTALSWWIFGLAGVLALGIALITVSWQTWRAATRNPVEALRYE